MKIKTVLLALMVVTTQALLAQHSESESHHTNGEHGKHKLSFYYGFTHVQSAFYEHETHEESTGKWVPTLGLDYYYALNRKWELGLIGDVELDNYYIRTTDENELERSNVVVLAAVGKYKPTKRIGLFAGPGYEWEIKKNESVSFYVLKVGFEYEVEIEKGWELTPVFSYDFKEEYSSYAFGVTIGKRF